MTTASVTTAEDRRGPALVPLLAILGAVIALASFGAVKATGILTGASAPPAPTLPQGPFGTSQDIPTSFGVVAVEYVEKIKGLRAKELAGMTHGVQGLVKADKMLVRANVTLTNLTTEPLKYSPTQFRMLIGKDRKPVNELRASFQPGALQPDAAIEGQLSFVAPRNGTRLWLAFDDPGRSKPILIDLGRTGKTPPGALKGFHHSRR